MCLFACRHVVAKTTLKKKTLMYYKRKPETVCGRKKNLCCIDKIKPVTWNRKICCVIVTRKLRKTSVKRKKPDIM